MNRKPLAAIAAVVLAGALVAIWLQTRQPPSPPVATQDWFYDLNTGQLFAGPVGGIPPIAAPSGPLPDGSPAGVRAHVYSCGDCAAASRTIAYLETYTLEDQRRLEELTASLGARDRPGTGDNQPGVQSRDGVLMNGRGSLVKRPGDEHWLARAHPDGEALVRESLPPCSAGKSPRECQP